MLGGATAQADHAASDSETATLGARSEPLPGSRAVYVRLYFRVAARFKKADQFGGSGAWRGAFPVRRGPAESRAYRDAPFAG